MSAVLTLTKGKGNMLGGKALKGCSDLVIQPLLEERGRSGEASIEEGMDGEADLRSAFYGTGTGTAGMNQNRMMKFCCAFPLYAICKTTPTSSHINSKG